MKDEKRIKEDCELLEAFVNVMKDNGRNSIQEVAEQFKKDNGLVVNQSGWYLDHNIPKWIGFHDFENDLCFGTSSDIWFNIKSSLTNKRNEYPATPEETLKRLSEFAVKLGYKEGVKVKSVISGVTDVINSRPFSLNDNRLYLGSNCIMKDGIWAEIIDEKEEIKKRIDEIQEELNELKNKL